MQTIELDIDTSRERTVDLTVELERFCTGLGDGLVNVFVSWRGEARPQAWSNQVSAGLRYTF